jgi:predicted transcriptional regulator
MTTTMTTAADRTAVRVRREQLGLTRAELAARAGCCLTYLQNIEAGVLPKLSLVMPRVEAVLAEAEAADHT